MTDRLRVLRSVALDHHFHIALISGPLVWWLLSFWVPISSGKTSLTTFAMVVLIYPLLEELAFRGFLQGWLVERERFALQIVPGITLANLMTSAVFALLHLLNQPPIWAASILLPSLVFGYFRDRYQLVCPSIVLHCWYNAGFVLLFY